jgi:DNA-binding CsgD family transcriptional regulator
VHAALRAGIPALTAREREVLRLLAAGKRNQEIADALCVSLKTVEFHVGHVLEKLGARSRTEAIVEARRQGLVV